jgi:hypothetical protein
MVFMKYWAGLHNLADQAMLRSGAAAISNQAQG